MSALDAHEHAERAEHAHHAADPFVTRVSITIALLAVFAAIVGSLETVESATAITATGRSVLAQDKATDAWNEYQADSLKKHIYGLAADQPGPNLARYRQTAADQQTAQQAVRARAETAAAESRHLMEGSELAERRHHWLTAAAALLEIGIGISSVSIITKNRLFWWSALGLGVAGAIMFAYTWIGVA